MSPTGKTLLGYGALVLFFFAYPVLWLLLIFRVHVSSDVAWWLAVFPHVCLVLFLGWCVRQLLLAKTLKRFCFGCVCYWRRFLAWGGIFF